MIIKSSHPLSPFVEVIINNRSVNYSSISNFEIELTENEHDMASITIQGINPIAVTDYIGAAVKLSINSGIGREHTFFGYIVSTEPVATSSRGLINDSPIHSTNLRCIGASLVMKETSSRVWDRPTIGNVLTAMAKKHNFSVTYPKDSFKPTRLAQANESDWSFLRRVADLYGYSISAHGTHISVWDSLRAVGRLCSFHALAVPDPKTSTGELPCTVIKFNADFGHHSISGDTSRASVTALTSRGMITKIDAKDGEMGTSRSVYSSAFTKPIKHPYRTFAEAKRAVESSQKHRTLYKATAEVVAGAGILPGGVVLLTQYGGDFDGIWYVASVTHKMGQSMYTTELVLNKDDNNGEGPPAKPTSLFELPPEPSLVQDRWVTSTKKVLEYV